MENLLARLQQKPQEAVQQPKDSATTRSSFETLWSDCRSLRISMDGNINEHHRHDDDGADAYNLVDDLQPRSSSHHHPSYSRPTISFTNKKVSSSSPFQIRKPTTTTTTTRDEDNTTQTTLDASYEGGDWSSNSESPLMVRRISNSSSSSENTSSSSSTLRSHPLNTTSSDDDDDTPPTNDDSLLDCGHDENMIPYSPPPKGFPQEKEDAFTPLSNSSSSSTHREQSSESHHEYDKRMQELEATNAKLQGCHQDSLANLQRELDEAKRQIEVFQFAWNEERGRDSSSSNMDIDILVDQQLNWSSPSLLQAQLEQYKLENAELRQEAAVAVQTSNGRRSPTMAAAAAAAASSLFSSIKQQSSPRSNSTVTTPQLVLPKLPHLSFSHADSTKKDQSSSVDEDKVISSHEEDDNNTEKVVPEQEQTNEDESTLISKLRTKNATLRSRLETEFSKVGSTKNELNRERERFHAEMEEELVAGNEELQKEVECLRSLQESSDLETKQRCDNYESILESEGHRYHILETKHAHAQVRIDQLTAEHKQLVEEEQATNESMEEYEAIVATLRFEKSNLLQKLEEEAQAALRASKQETRNAMKNCERLEEEVDRLQDQLEEQRVESVQAAAQHAAQQSKLLSDLEQLSISNIQLEARLEELQLQHQTKTQELQNKWSGRCQAVETRYTALEIAHETAQSDIARLQSSNDTLLSDRQTLQQSADDSERRISELESAHEQAQEKLSEALESKSETETQKKSLALELLEFQTSHAEMKNRLDEIEKRHTDCIGEMGWTLFGL